MTWEFGRRPGQCCRNLCRNLEAKPLVGFCAPCLAWMADPDNLPDPLAKKETAK